MSDFGQHKYKSKADKKWEVQNGWRGGGKELRDATVLLYKVGRE